jgi:hypothetical protein
MQSTYKASEIQIGYHPSGNRIDNTASAINRYTRWKIADDGTWTESKPVCFDSMPADGWLRAEKFDWN